jgi:glycosyltransferase involved in cell wall biosynthesis
VTDVARSLAPYRGFHVFVRSLPRLLAGNPALRVVVAGGDGVSYGRRPPEGSGSYRGAPCAELGDSVDWSRIHFLGKPPYASYRTVLQVSSLHIYLTYPFVPSWSVLGAMAVGVPVRGSDTGPVREVIRDGENGCLAGFFDSAALAERTLAPVAPRRDRRGRFARTRDGVASLRCRIGGPAGLPRAAEAAPAARA